MKRFCFISVFLFLIPTQIHASEYDDYGQSVVIVADEVWQRIEKIIARTDSALRTDLEAVFYSPSLSCDFINEWFDTWNRIADQEALVYERAKNLQEDLLVMNVKVRDPELKKTLGKTLAVIEAKIESSQEVLNSASSVRSIVADKRRYSCS